MYKRLNIFKTLFYIHLSTNFHHLTPTVQKLILRRKQAKTELDFRSIKRDTFCKHYMNQDI